MGQRRWSRYKISVPVMVIVRRGGKTILANGRGTEINEGGLAVFASAELDHGDDVDISFTPPYNSAPIQVRCTVRNRSGYTYGLEFLSDQPSDMDRIDRIRDVLRAMGTPR
jgi:hypothetical protein